MIFLSVSLQNCLGSKSDDLLLWKAMHCWKWAWHFPEEKLPKYSKWIISLWFPTRITHLEAQENYFYLTGTKASPNRGCRHLFRLSMEICQKILNSNCMFRSSKESSHYQESWLPICNKRLSISVYTLYLVLDKHHVWERKKNWNKNVSKHLFLTIATLYQASCRVWTYVQLWTNKVIKFDNLRTRILIKILTSDSESETLKLFRNGVALIFPRSFGVAKFFGIFNTPKSLVNQPSLHQFCTIYDPDVVDV